MFCIVNLLKCACMNETHKKRLILASACVVIVVIPPQYVINLYRSSTHALDLVDRMRSNDRLRCLRSDENLSVFLTDGYDGTELNNQVDFAR